MITRSLCSAAALFALACSAAQAGPTFVNGLTLDATLLDAARVESLGDGVVQDRRGVVLKYLAEGGRSQILDEFCIWSHLVRVHPQLLNNNLFYLLLDRFFRSHCVLRFVCCDVSKRRPPERQVPIVQLF